jgi:hypothetical protein
VGVFSNAHRHQYWLHAGPPDDALPEDHWTRREREQARATRCPRIRYRITVEVEELEDDCQHS